MLPELSSNLIGFRLFMIVRCTADGWIITFQRSTAGVPLFVIFERMGFRFRKALTCAERGYENLHPRKNRKDGAPTSRSHQVLATGRRTALRYGVGFFAGAGAGAGVAGFGVAGDAADPAFNG